MYSIHVSDLLGKTAFVFDANQDQRVFTFFYDADVIAAGNLFFDYTITLKAQMGVLNTVEAQSSFTLTLRNPCVDPLFVKIDKVLLPSDLTYALWEGDPGTGVQFSHDPYLVSTTPLVGHSLCGEVDYAVLFDG